MNYPGRPTGLTSIHKSERKGKGGRGGERDRGRKRGEREVAGLKDGRGPQTENAGDL